MIKLVYRYWILSESVFTFFIYLLSRIYIYNLYLVLRDDQFTHFNLLILSAMSWYVYVLWALVKHRQSKSGLGGLSALPCIIIRTHCLFCLTTFLIWIISSSILPLQNNSNENEYKLFWLKAILEYKKVWCHANKKGFWTVVFK